MPKTKVTVVAPEKVRLRLVQQVPPGTAGAFQDSVFGSWWTTTQSRGLNGTGGFISIEEDPILNDSSQITVELPPVGSDGRNNRDRLYLFSNTPDPQLTMPGGLPIGDVIDYMPGDEWLEVVRGRNDLMAVATPVSETSVPDSITIVCRDVTAVLKKQRETDAGFWNHAPRDVFEHYTRAWQTNVAEDFLTPSVFGTLNSSTPHNTTDGRWTYTGVAGVTSDILALQVPAGATTAQIAQDAAYPAVVDVGVADHSCWRAECSIVTANIPGAGATAAITLGVAPAGGSPLGLGGSYALTIGPAQGSVLAKTLNYSPNESGYYYDSWPVNAAGVLDSSNQLAPPYSMAIEARERWVFFYLDGQLVSVAPRTMLDSQAPTTTDARPFVKLSASPGDSIQLDYIVMRRTSGAMNGGQPGDYVLPSAPSPGGLQGAYYDTTLAFGPNGTVAGGQQLTQYGAAPPTFTPGTVRTDSGLFFSSGNVTHLPPPSPPSLSSVAPRSAAGLTSSANTYYKVTALNAAGETTPSTEAVIDGATALSPPTGMSSPFYGGNLSNPAGLIVVSNAFVGYPCLPGGTYTYQVTAFDSHGETLGSNLAQVSVGGYQVVGIQWATVTGAVGYNIYRVVGFGTPGYVTSIFASSTSPQGWVDTGSHGSNGSIHPPSVNTTGAGSLANSTHYWKVTAVNAAGGETTASAEVSGSPGFANAIAIISWTAVSGAVSYNVYRSDSTSGAEGFVGNTTSTGWGDYGTTAPGHAPPGSNSTSFYNATISWAAVSGATSYKVYRGTSSGSEAFLGLTSGTSYTDTGAAASGAPPSTNTASVPIHGTPGWFPAAVGNAQSAYVRWSGSIFLPLGGGSAVNVTLPSTNLSQALRIGRTRQGEAVCMSDSGYKAGFLGTAQIDFPGENLVSTSADLRTILGTTSGWYPIVFEYIYRLSDSTTSTVGFTYNVGGPGSVPSPYVLSPYGCFTEQIPEADSHFDVIQTAIGQTFALNWVSKPMSLESGSFPGIIVPRVRVGRDTDFVLDDEQAVNPQETTTAEDNATTDLAQAQGLGGSSAGGLTAEAFNFPVMAGHPFNLTEAENLPATSQLALLVLQLETLLGLRSNGWQQVTADSKGQRQMQDSWPLTGALQEFDWAPGDGLRINLPQVGVKDTEPRQIVSLKRMLYQDGLGQNAASFRPRPRDFAYTMRRFIKQVYSDRRTFQGQLTYVPGTQAVSPSFSVAPLPADTSLVRQATLTVLSKSDMTTAFSVIVNGHATGQTVLQPGTIDISNAIGRNNAVEPQMVVQLTSPASDAQVSYMVSLLVLVPKI